jgi:CheY-like chemotaxis protein
MSALISPVVMPGMSGIEAAIIVRRELPTCKILLFSGQAASSDLLDKARADEHVFELLSKPVHPTDLLAKGWGLSRIFTLELQRWEAGFTAKTISRSSYQSRMATLGAASSTLVEIKEGLG